MPHGTLKGGRTLQNERRIIGESCLICERQFQNVFDVQATKN